MGCFGEAAVAGINIKDVIELLDAQFADMEKWQLERLRKWIESLVQARGRDYVRENRQEILAKWEQYSKGKFKTCC
jgi:hypothetical protein